MYQHQIKIARRKAQNQIVIEISKGIAFYSLVVGILYTLYY